MAYPTPTKKSAKPASAPSMNQGSGKSNGGGVFKSLVTLVAILIIIVGGMSLLKGSAVFNFKSGGATFSADWQAVFLTNGQVYFGKVANVDRDNVNLEDIYYLQVVNQPLQRTQEEVAEEGVDLQQEQRLTLIKLGNELHGPTDAMVINRDHVILMEDLRDDSRVVQAIQDYVANN